MVYSEARSGTKGYGYLSAAVTKTVDGPPSFGAHAALQLVDILRWEVSSLEAGGGWCLRHSRPLPRVVTGDEMLCYGENKLNMGEFLHVGSSVVGDVRVSDCCVQ